MKYLQNLLDAVGFSKGIRIEALLLDPENERPIMPPLGTGKYLLDLSNDDESAMVFSLCVHHNYDPAVLGDNNGVFGISFVFMKEFYYFTAQFLSVCESVSMRIPEHVEDVYMDLSNHDEYKVYLLKAELITSPQAYRRPNRRDYFRTVIEMPIYYEIVPPDEVKHLEKHDYNPRLVNEAATLENFPGYSKLMTENISGGGFRGVTTQKLTAKSILDCVVAGTPELLPFYARIINVKPSKRKKDYYEVRAKFEIVNELARDKLVQYLFHISREERKKQAGLVKWS